MNSEIIGIGSALPNKCVTNDDLSKTIDTSDEWIFSRTGIKQRYIAEGTETTSFLATKAAIDALKHANISADEVDTIIVGTVTGDYTFPATAVMIQKKLGIKHGVAFDVSAACSGFLFALDIADSFIKSGRSKCALVIGAETFSKIMNWQDRTTCVLFGDGAGAVVIRATESDNIGIMYSKTYSDGSFSDYLMTDGGVSTTQTSGHVTMHGREVFRYGIEKFCDAISNLLNATNLKISDIDLLIPHQANIRITDKVAETIGIDRSKVLVTINQHANTSAASIPLALSTIRNEIFDKKNVVMLAMGAGFSWAASWIKFKGDKRNA